MATITSAGSGNWSAGATWVGGVAPASVDAAIIASGHTVTLNDTTCTCNTASITGTLTASTTVSSRLTFVTSLTVNSGGQVNIDVSSDPTVVCELLHTSGATDVVISAANGSVNFILKGAPKKRWTTLTSPITAGATSASVADTTGWRVGDTVVFGTTDITVFNGHDIVTLTSVSPGAIGWSGGVTYAHGLPGYVANMSSNMILRSTGATSTVQRRIEINCQQDPSTRTKKLTDVLVTGFNGSFTGVVKFISNFWQTDSASGISNCAIYNNWGFSASKDVAFGRTSFEDNAFFTVNDHATVSYRGHMWADISHKDGAGIRRNLFLRCAEKAIGGGNGGNLVIRQVVIEDNVFAGCGMLSPIHAAFGVWRRNRTEYGVNGGAYHVAGYHEGERYNVDTSYPVGYRSFLPAGAPGTYVNCFFPADNTKLLADNWVSTLSIVGTTENSTLTIVNRDADVTRQEIWGYQSRTKPTTARENTIKFRGASSLLISPGLLGAPLTRTQSIPCANGATIRIVGYVRMDTAFWNAGDNNLPTVTLTGLGATPVTFTASSAANNAWEQFDISITNTSGADGNFTLTYTANAKTVSTGTVYFDGVPDSPFVTKVRHYGFLFNETSPTREVNPYTVASESTAAAYTGVTVNATTKRVTFGIGTADTLNKVYDYSQAWAVTNIDKEVPWQRAGALLSLTSGWTVVDPVISGVTWGGGVIEWNTPGAINGSFDSTTFRFNSAGTYDLSGGTFAGTINLTNTSGGGVIVIVLPSGIDYVNDDPGTITVEVAVESATASITNIVPGSRLQVYNVTEDTEMVNTIVAGTSWSDSYPNGTGYSTGDVVRVRLAWMSGVTAKLPVQYQTVAASGGWSILADQVDDTVYNYNNIDGDTCTEFSHDFANVQVDVNDADNTTTVQRGYAWFIAGQMTEDGIKYFFGGITAEDPVNYRINAALVNLRIQNIKPNSNLTIRGGYIYRTDDTDIFTPGASGSTGSMGYGRAYTVRVGGGTGLSPEESAKLMSLPSASTVAAAVDASTVIAKEATAAAAKNNAALAAALSA